MTIAAEYWAGCSIEAMAAHHPPVDSPMVAHDERSVRTRKWCVTHRGTSMLRNVSTCGRPAACR